MSVSNWTDIQDLVSDGASVSSKLSEAFGNIDNEFIELSPLAQEVEDLSATVASTVDDVSTLKSYHGNEPTGFDHRDVSSLGIMELCPSSSGGMYWRLDENNIATEHTGQTTFGDGVTPLADRTFAHYKVSGQDDFSFWLDGVKIKKTTTQTLQLDNVPTKQTICYGTDGNLTKSSSIEEAIETFAICALVTGNPTLQQKVVFGNERHGSEMSPATHMMLHSTIGTQYGNGLVLSGMADNGTTFSSISAGEIWDEDIRHNVPAVTAAPFLYRDTQGYWALENDNGVVSTNALGMTVGGNIVYNQDLGNDVWALTDVGGGYVIINMFGTNDGQFPIFKQVGQEVYADRNTARDRLEGEMARFQEGELPTPEMIHLYSYIIDSSGRIETGADGEVYIDFKQHYPIDRF